MERITEQKNYMTLLKKTLADDITTLSATEMATRIASGALSASEVVEAHLQRIKNLNPQINALVVPLFEQARAEAAVADAVSDRQKQLRPLHGVPITIKESFDVAGTPTTMGMSERMGHRATTESLLVQRLRQAGAIILGKTNVFQLLILNEADNPVYNRTNNPWNRDRSSGGSSGGEAAIIAAGGSALGLGSDIGGSIRMPAHACGIHGLKPTSGRLTMHGHGGIYLGQEAILAQPGPMARSVNDLALAMKILAAPGQEAKDPSIAPVPLRDPAAVSVPKLRVAFYTDNGVIGSSPALRRAVTEAATALAQMGAEVEEWTPPDIPKAWELYMSLLCADGMAWAVAELGKSQRDWRIDMMIKSSAVPKRISRTIARLLDWGGQHQLAKSARCIGSLSASEYWQLICDRNWYRAQFMAAMDAGRFDVILCPPQALPALTHGSSYDLVNAVSYTALYNLLGMPAGVVTATRVRPEAESDRKKSSFDLVERKARSVEMGSAGLPVGVQVVARHWREDVALAVMEALEQHFQKQPDYPIFSSL